MFDADDNLPSLMKCSKDNYLSVDIPTKNTMTYHDIYTA